MTKTATQMGGGGSFRAPDRIRPTACTEWTRMNIVGRIMIKYV